LSANLRLAVFVVLAGIVAGMWGLSFVSKRFEHAASRVEVLEPHEFTKLTLVTVGTGGSFANPARLGPALAVGLGRELVLVDAGRGVVEALRQAGLPASQVQRVLLTSLTAENTVGLDDLWLTGWLGPREQPLQVVGPPGTRALVEGLRSAHAAAARALQESWQLPKAGGRIEVAEVTEDLRQKAGDLILHGVALAGGPAPALCWRIDGGGHSLVIDTVGWGRSRVQDLARGADLLVVSAIFGRSLDAALAAGVKRPEVLKREASRHLLLEEIGALARDAGVRGLVLARLRPPPAFAFPYKRVVTKDFHGPVAVADDGQTFTP